ncbi:NUDIX hydrolase [Deminuibacter soli]|uniref:NUDIX hydrolase n=1 Tax=Deminuibacter soli TaxID=2291815 RepID=A0A3E1NHY1_9BACT|nr:NUDIX domain-containing protein [Deminuibacter soli]RFM27550.1 NUDIX hydrolase [Deminuibacter soli]
MSVLTDPKKIALHGGKYFLPQLSVDCVILGFHDGELKVLLLKMHHSAHWALPGGFIYKEETVDDAAHRVLEERTGLKNLFLQQFHVFGNPARSSSKATVEYFKKEGIHLDKNSWLAQRFVTVGYYALVDFAKAQPHPDLFSDACEWVSLREAEDLFMDHSDILQKALETVRLQLNYQPIGFNLLPRKFTMPELQRLYETILGKPLDRRNFQRRMLAYGILKKLAEQKKGVAHKAPFLYSFDTQRYRKALAAGLDGGW